MTYLNAGHGTEMVGVSQWADWMLVVADAGEGYKFCHLISVVIAYIMYTVLNT
jgi:hypothetical protein